MTSKPSRARVASKIALAIVVVVLLGLEFRAGLARRIPVNDFLEYWAAARLTLDGEDPYSHSAMFRLEQQALGLPTEKPLMMWNPPFVLPFVLPFGFMSLAVGRAVMGVVGFATIFGSAESLWRYYGGDADRRWIAWAVAAVFAPVFAALASGQISPFVLLGVAAFLWLERRRHHFAAGACLLLMALKPHLLYLVWIAIAVWIVEGRRWRVAAGAMAAFLIALSVALLADRQILQHYVSALRTESMLALYAPPLGGLLRVTFGWHHYWLQFVPSTLGAAWLVWRRSAAAEFDLIREFPLLLMISVCTSPYGWLFDQIVLLPAVAQRAVQFGSASLTDQSTRLWATVWLAGNVLCLVQIVATGTILTLNFAWVAPFFLAVYAATGKWWARRM
jgi:Glycosyltransferase family 87